MTHQTKLAKWGNSYAVRIPAEFVAEMQLQDGQELNLKVKEDGSIELSKRMTLEDVNKILERIRKPLPPGYKFNREECHQRGSARIQEKQEEQLAS